MFHPCASVLSLCARRSQVRVGPESVFSFLFLCASFCLGARPVTSCHVLSYPGSSPVSCQAVSGHIGPGRTRASVPTRTPARAPTRPVFGPVSCPVTSCPASSQVMSGQPPPPPSGTLCPVPCTLCPMPYTPCPVPYALYPLPCSPCLLPYTATLAHTPMPACRVPRVLWSVPDAGCPVLPCPVFYAPQPHRPMPAKAPALPPNTGRWQWPVANPVLSYDIMVQRGQCTCHRICHTSRLQTY